MNITELAMLKKMAGSGSGGGLSIKKIEFTDRPTLHDWLQNNVGKVLKTTITTNQFPAPINCTHIVAVNVGDGFYSLQQTFCHVVDEVSGKVVMDASMFEIKSTEVSFGTSSIGTGVTMQVIPDEYWAAMEVVVTIYYIE